MKKHSCAKERETFTFPTSFYPISRTRQSPAYYYVAYVLPLASALVGCASSNDTIASDASVSTSDGSAYASDGSYNTDTTSVNTSDSTVSVNSGSVGPNGGEDSIVTMAAAEADNVATHEDSNDVTLEESIDNAKIIVDGAQDAGIRGKDYTVLKNATINVTAAADGFKSNNDNDDDLDMGSGESHLKKWV